MLAGLVPAVEQEPNNGTIPQPGNAAFLPLLSNNNLPTATPEPPPTALPTATEAPPTETPLPTTPPQPIPVGESITCHGMRVVAQSSEIRDSLGGTPAPQGGQFLITIAHVTNVGFEPNDISRFDVAVRDSQGRKFRMAELEAQWAAQDLYGYEGVYTDISPSLSETLVFVWLIAPGATGMSFVSDTLCDL